MFADDYQQMSMRTAGEARSPRDMLITGALGLTGESGEVADLVKKHVAHGHALDEQHLREELGDVSWYIAFICSAMGWNWSEILRENQAKLARRYPQGFSTEASIARVDKAS